MNKKTIRKEYEKKKKKRSELSKLISNFDTNTEFSHSSLDLLFLLKQNLNQKLKILDMIARTEKIYENDVIQDLTSTSGD